MSEQLFTIATFSQSVEAEQARSRLTAEGIPAFLSGEAAPGWQALGTAVASIQLQVPADHLQRASQILAAAAPKDESPAPVPESSSSDTATTEATCPRCGTKWTASQSECPGCGTPIDGSTPRFSRWTTEMAPAWPDSPVAPSLEDHLASRALQAAVVGLLLPPFPQIYSAYLLLRLALFRGALGPEGRRKALIALLIDLAVFAVVALLLGNL